LGPHIYKKKIIAKKEINRKLQKQSKT